MSPRGTSPARPRSDRKASPNRFPSHSDRPWLVDLLWGESATDQSYQSLLDSCVDGRSPLRRSVVTGGIEQLRSGGQVLVDVIGDGLVDRGRRAEGCGEVPAGQDVLGYAHLK